MLSVRWILTPDRIYRQTLGQPYPESAILWRASVVLRFKIFNFVCVSELKPTESIV